MISEKVATYLAASKGLSGDTRIRPDTQLVSSGLIDSLGMEDLIGYLEATFGIALDDEDLVPDNFETVSAITALVERKMAPASDGMIDIDGAD